MNMIVDPNHAEATADAEKRDFSQPSQRNIGRLVLCTGSRAIISSSASSITGANGDFWSIGRLISISGESGRVIGVVYELSTTSELWNDNNSNTIYIKVELVGEIRDTPEGPNFRSGIATYPYLGAIAHRIRTNDLRAIYRHSGSLPATVGTLSQDESIEADIDIEMMLSRHFAVVGTTGVGKSSAVSILVRKAVERKPNLRVLVLDPHNEYSKAFSDISITLDSDTLELPFWMFRLEEFADVVFRGRRPDDSELDILREMIGAAKSKYSAPSTASLGASSLIKRPISSENSSMTADTPMPYRMSDLLKLIDDEMGKLESKHSRTDLRSVMHRLSNLTQDPRFRFMFARSTIEDNMEGVLAQIYRIPMHNKPITVLQLAGIPSEVVNSVASVLARMAFDVAMWSQGTYEILLLCEEAHRYVPADPTLSFGPTRAAIARIAKEGRKYGSYLGIVTQRPGELDATILSQCSSLFAMRLANERDQDIIRSAVSDSSASTISFLSSIGNREAIAFGEAVGTPMRLKFVMQRKDQLPEAASGVAETDRASVRKEADMRMILGRMRVR
ncbi:MAG: ATP-binding protein [Hyphomicrobiales bacterium]|nr:ATP-binding protein [Hyphomicrobiales bacterium]MDE2115972.1 ATP-binding protein [Hyphomicrobiales bacterium]